MAYLSDAANSPNDGHTSETGKNMLAWKEEEGRSERRQANGQAKAGSAKREGRCRHPSTVLSLGATQVVGQRSGTGTQS